MSGNKVGSPPPPPSSPEPGDSGFLPGIDAELAAAPPVQPFSLNQQQQQQQQPSGEDDSSSTNAAKDKAKKDAIAKQQVDQSAQNQALENPAAVQKPATTAPQPIKTATTPTPVPTTKPAPAVPPSKQATAPSPFTLASQQKPPETAPKMPTAPSPTTKPLAETPKPVQTAPTAAPTTKPLAETPKPVQTVPIATPTKPSTDQLKPAETAASQAAAAAASLKEAPAAEEGLPGAFAAAAAQTAATAADKSASSVSSISEKFEAGVQTTTSKDTDWGQKQKLSEKADTVELRLDQSSSKAQVSDQAQFKADTTASQTPTVATTTGADVATRAAEVLRTQEDFINLVASIATSEKQTSVQLKDGTLINLAKTTTGSLNISVTTPDTRIHRLLLDNTGSITQALKNKNIEVANLDVSLGFGGTGTGPVDEVGKEG